MTERYVFDPSISHFTDTKTDKIYCEYNLDKVVEMLNNYEKLINQLENGEAVHEFERRLINLTKIIKEISNDNRELKEQLKTIEDNFEFKHTQNYIEFDKEALDVKDTHTTIHLKDNHLFIDVYIPQITEHYHMEYFVTGRSLMREFEEY